MDTSAMGGMGGMGGIGGVCVCVCVCVCVEAWEAWVASEVCVCVCVCVLSSHTAWEQEEEGVWRGCEESERARTRARARVFLLWRTSFF
jgi:hypothetical protein